MELRRVPQLRELHVQVHIGMDAPSALTVACPPEAAMIAGCYANHSYTSIRVLSLTLQWLLPRGMEDPAERFMKRTETDLRFSTIYCLTRRSSARWSRLK
jgi:hypothetical protein